MQCKGTGKVPNSINTTNKRSFSRMDSNDRNVFIPKRLASGVLGHNTAPRAYFGRPINKFVPLWLDCWLQSHHNSSVGY